MPCDNSVMNQQGDIFSIVSLYNQNLRSIKMLTRNKKIKYFLEQRIFIRGFGPNTDLFDLQ
jgi:hypothetical protein